MNEDELVHWLEQDDAKSRLHRARRARQALESIEFPENGFLFFGGMEASQSFTEARLAYVNGLYLATVLLALVVVEQELAGTLYTAGSEKVKKLKFEALLDLSLEERLITHDEYILFNKLRDVRNAYSHFRPISHQSNLARRAMNIGTPMEDLLKDDALNALKAINSLAQSPSGNEVFGFNFLRGVAPGAGGRRGGPS